MEHIELYDIPNIENYKITKSGKVWSVKNKRFIKEQQTGRGYVHYILYLGDIKRAFFRHRLLCMVFKPIANSKEYSVDHINGIPGDDRLENLEWVTHKENVRRYWKQQYPVRTEPILRYDLTTGSITEYPTHLALAKELQVSRYEILRRLSRRFGFVFKDLSLLKYKSDQRPFPVITNASLQRLKDKLSKEVVCFNHNTGERRRFTTMVDCADFLNVVPSVVTTRLKNNDNFFLNGLEIQLAYTNPIFKRLTPVELFRKVYSRRSHKAVFLYMRNEVLFFISSKELATFINMPASTLSKYLNDSYDSKNKGHFYLESLNADVYDLDHVPDELITKYIKCNELDEQ